MIRFVLNGEPVTADCSGGLPSVDWIRRKGLMGTREGCREGDCGACTVILGRLTGSGMEYGAVCSCLLPMAAVHGCHLVTIEGLSAGGELTPLQKAFHEEGASQCGFCTPGMIMSLTGFLLGGEELTIEGALDSLDGNICRCTGYVSVKRAVSRVMAAIPEHKRDRLEVLLDGGHIQEYFRDVPGLLSSIEERETGGGALVAGGTDLYVNPESGVLDGEPALVTDAGISSVVERHGGTVTAGAAATVKTLRDSPVFRELFPGIDGFLGRIASTQIRQRATLGGNIMNGSPIADLAVLFLALDATVHAGELSVPLREFYLGYKQFAVEKGTLISSLSFPVPRPGSRLSALKVCKREYLDIASVNSAALVTAEGGVILEACFSAGGVAPYPLYLAETSGFLTGRELSPETLSDAERVAASEISPISDVRGSARYKTLLLQAQIRAHLTREAGR